MLNLDTHILIGFLNGTLKESEMAVIRKDRFGISSMVIWEIAKLHQLGRIPLGIEDPRLSTVLSVCHVWELDTEVALASTRLDFRSDPADEIIAATSIVHEAPLLTRDEKLLESKIVPLALRNRS